MKHLRWLKRIAGAIAGQQRDQALDDEIETHLAMQTKDNLKLGMTEQEARRAALLKFGPVASIKEGYRDQRGLPALEALAKDMRLALRSLRKNPEFAASAILSLALGIGATTAIFTVADTVLLRPMPYAAPDRLSTVSVDGAISAPVYDIFRTQARSIESAALFTSWYFNLAGRGEPERIPAARISATLFSLLGVQPELGRTFTAEEDQTGRENVVVIGDGLWKRRFGRDPNIVGRVLRLNDAPYTVIGVMPPGFRFPEGPEHHATVGPFPPAEMWRPVALVGWEKTCQGCFNFAMLARLRSGVSPAQASAELTAILKRAAGANKAETIPPVSVTTLQNAVTGKVRTPILILFGAVMLALLIACVNVANLLLARGLRRKEMAVRLSIGATRARLIQQGLTEALTLGLCAAPAALVIAYAGVRGLLAIAPQGIPRIDAAAVDPRMFGFALALALATAVVFGIGPAILAARSGPGEAMKSGSRTMSAAPSRLRAALVAAELALSLLLLVGSGLLAKSFLAVSQVPLGFRTENILTMQISLPERRYDERSRTMLVERLVADCSRLTGVISAAATSTLPLTGEAEGWGVLAQGNPNRDEYTSARVRAVTPGYFETLGIRLRAGRTFNESDNGKQAIAIVSQSLARRLWQGAVDVVGKRLAGKPPTEIIGVVDDTRASGIDAEMKPYLYVSFARFAPPDFAIAIRTASDPLAFVSAIRNEIRQIDKEQPITGIATMKQVVADTIAPRRFQAVIMSLFAAFALALAAIGNYGILSYSVAQRTQEIGIRIALGSTRARVITDVMKQACLLAIMGAAIGLIAAFRLTPLLRSLLYGVQASDVGVFAGSAVVLIGVAALASLIPARRAAKLDPIRCLRYE